VVQCVVQSGAEWCKVVQSGVVWCSVAQCCAVRYSMFCSLLQYCEVGCSVGHCVAERLEQRRQWRKCCSSCCSAQPSACYSIYYIQSRGCAVRMGLPWHSYAWYIKGTRHTMCMNTKVTECARAARPLCCSAVRLCAAWCSVARRGAVRCAQVEVRRQRRKKCNISSVIS